MTKFHWICGLKILLTRLFVFKDGSLLYKVSLHVQAWVVFKRDRYDR